MARSDHADVSGAQLVHGGADVTRKRFPFFALYFRQQVGGDVRYVTTLVAEKAVKFLRAKPANQPFCLALALAV
jgi:hypothetical protein